MIFSTLEDAKRYEGLLRHDIWALAFSELMSLDEDSPLGVRNLGITGAFIDVHRYRTRGRGGCVWESHAHMIDLQFMIRGTEHIDYQTTDRLGEPYVCKPGIDRYEYRAAQAHGTITLARNFWVIFFPRDGHRPMIRVDNPEDVLKAVVKIPCSAVEM